MWRSLGVCSVVTACAASPSPHSVATTHSQQVAARFLADIPTMLTRPVTIGGLPASGGECAQLATPQQIDRDKLALLGRCLQAMHLRLSSRANEMADYVVLEADGGFELEAHFLELKRSTNLVWIGFEPTSRGIPGEPTLTYDAFNALRTTPAGPSPVVGTKRESAFLEVCLDPDGAATTVARQATSLRAAAAFTEATRAWKFRPFVRGGDPTPVCTHLQMSSGPTTEPDAKDLAAGWVGLPPPEHMRDVVLLGSTAFGKRVSGAITIVPDDATKTQIQQSDAGQVTVTLAYCIDQTGKVVRLDRIRTSGYPGYDAVLAGAVSDWRYEPYREDGAPVPACSVVTFHYSQK